jgi:hypothetical protein
MATFSSSGFWERVGLEERDKEAYIEVVQGVYFGRKVEEFEHQGYCSFTLIVHPWDSKLDSSNTEQQENGIDAGAGTLIVQFRPLQHALSLDITDTATKVYPDLAPRTFRFPQDKAGHLVGYVMRKLPGKPLSLLQPQTWAPDTEIRRKQVTLIKDFAASLAQNWHSTLEALHSVRADSPVSTPPSNMLSNCTGKVGQVIIPKLNLLARNLPDAALRQRAQTVLEKIQSINADSYPVVLTHGDLIPSNILVHEHTWRVTGLVDWAEAEYLPFGTCLYGLEHLLGYMPSASQFVYYGSASRLRELFWECLWEAVPELKARRDEVMTMRDLGVLLWHGFAWDEGKIDRVVDERRDESEVVRLRAFLGVE